MIDQKKVTEAIREFVKDPAWNDVFVNAPPGAMERLAIAFYFSKFKDSFQAEDFDEYRNLREELERSLTEEDLNYLITATDKEETVKHYQELLEQLQASGGEPKGTLKVETQVEEAEGEAGGEEKEETEETVVEEEAPAQEQPPAEEDEKKKDLTGGQEKPGNDEKANTALSVALEYLQNEKKAIEGGQKEAESPKTN